MLEVTTVPAYAADSACLCNNFDKGGRDEQVVLCSNT